MRGNKGLQRDALSEHIYRASLRPSFQKEIAAVRENFNIQPHGWKTKKRAIEWYMDEFSNSWKRHSDFFAEIDILITKSKYGLPHTVNSLLESYVIGNDRFDFHS